MVRTIMAGMSIRSMYPRLVVSDGAAAIDFYLAAFGAKEIERHGDPDTGKIVHAALAFGEFVIAVKDEDTDHPAPTSLGGSPVIIALDVDDADAVGAAMERAGATVIHPIQDWDYGQRAGRLADPYGHLWMISQPIE
ncbi:MAG: VOC family protein [Gammaproteobacteria bacterium]